MLNARKLIVGVGALSLALVCHIAQAAPVTFYFGGDLTQVGAGVSPIFHMGDAFAGSYTFESTTPNTGTVYGDYNAILSLTITVDGLTYSGFQFGGPPSGWGIIEIANDIAPFGDAYFITNTLVTGPSVNGNAPWFFFLQMYDHSSAAFSSNALLTSPSILANLTPKLFDLVFDPGDNIRGSLSYFSTTAPNSAPEPMPLLLIGLGLAGLGFRRRRNQQAA